MRVLIVEPFPGQRWRSITRYADGLETALTAAGASVKRGYAPWWNPPSIARGAAAGWSMTPSIHGARQGRVDVVHIVDHALAHHIRRFKSLARVCLTVHDLMSVELSGYFHGPIAPVKRMFLRRPMRATNTADVLVVPSEATRAAIERLLGIPANCVAVIPNPLDSRFAPTDRAIAERLLAEAGIYLPPVPRVLSVGHDGTYKNLPALLEALTRPGLERACLVRAGARLNPRRFPAVRQLAREGRLVELGPVDDRLLVPVYAACDVLAQPSLAEGFGYPLLEAMAMGLPAVVSDGGALPEVAGGAARIVPLAQPDFAGAFARALAEVLDDPGLAARMRDAGHTRAADFSVEAVGRRLLEAYRSMA